LCGSCVDPVYDSVCKTCLKANMVDTSWAGSQLETCPTCPLDDCHVITIYRDCQNASQASNRWYARKIVSERWTRYYKLLDLC